MTESVRQDADAMALLKMYVDLTNSERQAIWARTGAMLVSNSFIINAIKSEEMKWLAWDLSLAGLLICIIWAVITWRGWGYYELCMSEARKLAITPELNPFHRIERPKGVPRVDVIYLCTMLLIVVFATIYWVLLRQSHVDPGMSRFLSF